MMKPRALMATAFALGLAFAACGSITTQDGGTPGTAGAGAGTAGTSGTAGKTGGAGTSGVAGSAGGTTGQGGMAGASAGRGGNNNGGAGGGSVAGRGGSNNGGAGGRGGSSSGGAGGRGGSNNGGAGGRGGTTGGNGGTALAGRGGSSGGRGGTGGGGGGGSCICPTIEMPVCGVDGKTYANDCVAACGGIAIAYQGACVTECQATTDCVHYADGVGDCCGACLPNTAPKPGMISCLVPCNQPITCPCVVGKCLATPAGGAAASQ